MFTWMFLLWVLTTVLSFYSAEVSSCGLLRPAAFDVSFTTGRSCVYLCACT